MNIIKLINKLRMISKICAVGAFAVGFLALCEYFGNPEMVELLTVFKWFGYSAVFAVFAKTMEIAQEEITNNINSTERV